MDMIDRKLSSLVLAASLATTAHASLGGDANSIDSDRLRMNVAHAARVTPAPAGAYTVHEATLPNGTTVRQYLSAAGVVFAVSWTGPFKPDLRQLLGPHFDTMLARQSGHGHVHVGQPFVSQQNTDLVVESGGHPRSFRGRAYLPAALPDGLSAEVIE